MLRELKGSMATERGRARARRRKMIRSAFVTVGVFLLLGAAGALGYIWYVGNSKPVEVAALPDPKPKIVKEQPKKSTEPSGPVSIAEQSFITPVVAGSNSSLTIRTRADAACSISVKYNNQPSKDGGLIPKTADEFGNVQWTWTIEKGQPVGKWPVEVTCGLGTESAYYKTNLEITN